MQTWRGHRWMTEHLWRARLPWVGSNFMVVAKTEGGALSTCEAEYVAAAIAACQVVWLHRLLGELTGVEAHPPALMVDNQPAIALAKNPVLHDRSKHIDVKFHFLKDCVDEGQIVIEFIETGRQLANVLTKPLGRLRLTELKEMIGMEGVQGIAVGLDKELLE